VSDARERAPRAATPTLAATLIRTLCVTRDTAKPPHFCARSSAAGLLEGVVRVELRFRGNAKSAANAASSQKKLRPRPESSRPDRRTRCHASAPMQIRSSRRADEIRADSHRYARASRDLSPSVTRRAQPRIIPFADRIRRADESAILKSRDKANDRSGIPRGDLGLGREPAMDRRCRRRGGVRGRRLIYSDVGSGAR